MPRRNVVEIMDLQAVPSFLREGITGALRASEELFRPYDSLIGRMASLVAMSGSRRVVDLCSGAGGPLPSLFHELRLRGLADELVMTDRLPHAGAIRHAEGRAGVRYLRTPVDAAKVDPSLVGLRTMFNALHHLPPRVAREVFADAARSRQPLLVVESLSRTPSGVLGALNVALSAYATLPVPGPGWMARALLTWPVPVLPMALMWEGAASCFRCYDDGELSELIGDSRTDYRFSVERVRVPHLPFLWLTVVEGRPMPIGSVPDRGVGVGGAGLLRGEVGLGEEVAAGRS